MKNLTLAIVFSVLAIVVLWGSFWLGDIILNNSEVKWMEFPFITTSLLCFVGAICGSIYYWVEVKEPTSE